MKFIVVTILVFVAVCCVAQDGANIYCGRRLSEAWAKVCWDGGVSKRDNGWDNTRENTMERTMENPMENSMEHPMENSNWQYNTLEGSRGKRGIVDECCMKPCTVDEITTYC